jgi:hypothetical protein
MSSSSVSATTGSTTASSAEEVNHDGLHDLVESRQRRRLELRLLHQYMGYTCNTATIFIDAQPKIEYFWKVAMPALAFDHDALLYSIYTFAALHLSKLEPNNQEFADAYRHYLELTIKTHRDQVANLNGSNADATCIVSNTLRSCVFAVMEARNRDPYTPPITWLSMTKSASGVYTEAWKWISDDETSIARALWKATPQLRDWDAMFAEGNRKNLNHLLQRTSEDEVLEPWDEDIAKAYASTVSYIGGVKIAIEESELEPHYFRRVVTFAMYIERRFIDLVEERRPRALVILAHYFALVTTLKRIWWIGDCGEKEILGIMTILPNAWKHLMAWPWKVLKDPSLLKPQRAL